MFNKKTLIIIICLVLILGLSAFSDDQIIKITIDQTPVETELPILKINDHTMIPIIDTFRVLGAQVYDGDVITSYYLNTFVKINIIENYYAINGKHYKFEAPLVYRDNALYVPIEVLMKSFDLNKDSEAEDTLNLNANSVIQYRNIDAIQYKQVSFDNDGVRFSVPLDWMHLDNQIYGYNSSYGRISVEFSSRDLNENIDLNVVMSTFQEHLMMENNNQVSLDKTKQQFYNYLTSNVLYITKDVNGVIMNEVVHFVKSEGQVYIIDFNYPQNISDAYMLEVIHNILNSFYIDSISFDANSEHYIETMATHEYNLKLTSEVYSNMVVIDKFIVEGYFDTEALIDSLTVTVERNNESLEFYVPIENHGFCTTIYTPFGLGKHNIHVSLSTGEEKVTFDIDGNPIQKRNNPDLLHFSVVNVSHEITRYTIPTKMVESQNEYLSSMSDLLTYKFHTNYSKAKSLYEFIVEEIEILDLNEVNYSALDVYENFKGTNREISLYLTALLRAQNIPTRIVEGETDFSSHIWTEVYLNGSWIILDPVGDQVFLENITSGVVTVLEPSFNSKRSLYNDRYINQKILEY